MTWDHALARTAELLAVAPPYDVPAHVVAALREGDPTATATVLLADYRLFELRPAPTAGGAAPGTAAGEPLRIDESEPGRVFVTQRPMRLSTDHDTVIAPLSVHGDRLGVLVVRSAGLTEADDAPQRLAVLAALVAQALLAAEPVTDVYRVARRARSLSLAAEMQWDTLPGRSLDAGFATVAGQLEPAHQVVGDSYDWVVNGDRLSAMLVDGSGYGTQAAGSSVFTVEAVRNARREGADLMGTARLADAALFARFGGDLTTSALLLDLDPMTLELRIIQAGAAVALLTDRTSTRRLSLDSHPPLGAEEDHPYTAQSVPLGPGDRLVIASDGLTEATVHGRFFGDGLERTVRGYRLLGAAELVRAVVRDLVAFHAGYPQLDDAVVLCLDVP